MAEIDTWMPWHIADYLADTMHLSTLEHGAYLLILAHGWRNGGKIACGDGQMAKVTRMPLDQWKAIRPTIEAFFEPFTHPTHGACWKQKRQVEEIERAKAQKEKAHDKAVKANKARWASLEHPSSNAPSNPQALLDDSPQEGKGKGSSNLPPEGIAYRLPSRSQEAVALATQHRGDPPTAKQEFWEPLCRIFGLEPKTQADELRLYEQCRDFRLKGATVSELERRAGVYRVSFPTVAFTPKAVLSNWDNLKEVPKPKTFGPPLKKSKAFND